MLGETSDKVWLLKFTTLLILVGLAGWNLTVIPSSPAHASQPPPTPTPTLVPPAASTVTESAVPQIQTAPLSGVTTQDTLQTLTSLTVLETLSVRADGTPVQTRFNLAQGIVYTIRVTGMFVWGGCDPFSCPDGSPEYFRWGDAGFLTDDHWHGFSDPFWSGFIYLEVNGDRPNFGPYNASHLYTIQVTGNGQPVTFRIQDCAFCYGDNAGALRVEIIEGTNGGAFTLGVIPFQQRSLPAGLGEWGNNKYGQPAYIPPPDAKVCGDTIVQCGCRLTTWAMILDFYGFQHNFHTNPHELNKWLREHRGYNGLLVNPRKVLEYARKETPIGPLSLESQSRNNQSDQKLHDLLAAGIPVDLRVYTSLGEHHVLAVGETTTSEGTRTWYINDPGFKSLFEPNPTLKVGYNNSYDLLQWSEQPGPVMLASITLVLGSPAELLVTDPQGRRTGVDPRTGTTYNEIPDAFYYVEALADDSDQNGAGYPYKVFDMSAPPNGSYIIQVIGTGSGAYTLDILNYDELGDPAEATVSGQIEKDNIDTYRLDYSSAPGSEVVVVPVTAVDIDIKPGSDPNSINCTNKEEVIPVAILTTDTFDATTVDHTTVTFEGASETHVDKKTGQPLRHEQDVDGDGDIDLVFHFRLGDTTLTCGSTEGTLTGETFDAISIQGTDAVRMVGGIGTTAADQQKIYLPIIIK